MITIYGRATSSNVQAVMWGIGELGLTHERLDYGHNFGHLDAPDFRALTPHRLIPVLRDGDVTLWESCAILRYLAAKYGDGGPFWPADPAARAYVDMWAEWGKTSLARSFTGPIFWARVRISAQDRDGPVFAAALTKFDGLLAILDTQLEGKNFVCGPDFTLADIVIAHVLYRYHDIDIARKKHQNIAGYYGRLCARPPYQKHVMVSYDTLKAKDA